MYWTEEKGRYIYYEYMIQLGTGKMVQWLFRGGWSCTVRGVSAVGDSRLGFRVGMVRLRLRQRAVWFLGCRG